MLHFVRQGWDGTDQGHPRKAPFDSRGKIPGAGHPMIEAFHRGQSTLFSGIAR
jgi:hypothetical protein